MDSVVGRARRPARAHPRRGRRAPARLAAALLGLVLLALAGGPAAAHDRLVGSEPAAGSVATPPLSRLVLTYSDRILAVGAEVTVHGPDGRDVAGPPAIDGTDVVVPLAQPMAAGGHTVTWRVVSSDGHPIDGTFTFAVAAAPAAEQTATERPTPSPAAPEETPTGPPDPDAGPVLPPLVRAAVTVAAVGALAAGAVVTIRRRRES